MNAKSSNIEFKIFIIQITVLLFISISVFGQDKIDAQSSWFSRSLELKGIAIEDDNWQIWGCSPIVDTSGNIHLFVARWPKETGHEGWYTKSQIAHYIGETPEGPFKFHKVVLKGTLRDTWDKFAPHNPTIHKVGNTYALFYIANTGSHLRPKNQKIGMMVSKSLYGAWEKAGKDGLILSPPQDSSFYNYNSSNGVVNPSFLQMSENEYLLYFKSNDMRKKDSWKPMMGLAISKELVGPYFPLKTPITNNDKVIEDGYAFKFVDKIYLVTTDNHGMIEKGGGLIWESEDGRSFSNPKQAFRKLDFYFGGKLPVKSKLTKGEEGNKIERPQILMIEGVPKYLYAPSGTNVNGGEGSVCYVFKINEELLPK